MVILKIVWFEFLRAAHLLCSSSQWFSYLKLHKNYSQDFRHKTNNTVLYGCIKGLSKLICHLCANLTPQAQGNCVPKDTACRPTFGINNNKASAKSCSILHSKEDIHEMSVSKKFHKILYPCALSHPGSLPCPRRWERDTNYFRKFSQGLFEIYSEI